MNSHYCDECKHYTAWRRALAWFGIITLVILVLAFIAFLIIGTNYVYHG